MACTVHATVSDSVMAYSWQLHTIWHGVCILHPCLQPLGMSNTVPQCESQTVLEQTTGPVNDHHRLTGSLLPATNAHHHGVLGCVPLGWNCPPSRSLT